MSAAALVKALVCGMGSLLAVLIVISWGLLETGIDWHKCDRKGPEYFAQLLDFCVFCTSLKVFKLWNISGLAEDPTLIVVWWVCKMSTEFTCLNWPGADLARGVTSLGHNMQIASYLSLIIVLVLRMIALQPELRMLRIGFNWLAQEFLQGFLPTAVVGEIVVMWRCHSSTKKAEFIEHEAKLYILCLYLSWFCSILAWQVCHRIRLPGPENPGEQEAVSKFEKASASMCRVKTVWCIAFTVQTVVWFKVDPEKPESSGPTQLHRFAFVIERACAIWSLYLLKEFAKLYSGLRVLPES